jgi:hypothetical protein
MDGDDNVCDAAIDGCDMHLLNNAHILLDGWLLALRPMMADLLLAVVAQVGCRRRRELIMVK